MSKLKIIILFVVVLTIPSYFILKSKNLDFSLANIFSFKTEERNPMQEKIDAVEKTGELIITEEELLSWIKPYAKTVEGLKVDITVVEVAIAGETTLPTRSSLDIAIVPIAKEGKLTYNVTRMNMGKVKAPDYLAGLVTNAVNKQLDSKINDILKVKSVTMQDGSMTLVVERK